MQLADSVGGMSCVDAQNCYAYYSITTPCCCVMLGRLVVVADLSGGAEGVVAQTAMSVLLAQSLVVGDSCMHPYK